MPRKSFEKKTQNTTEAKRLIVLHKSVVQHSIDVEHKRRRGSLAWLLFPRLEMSKRFLLEFEVTNRKTMNCFFQAAFQCLCLSARALFGHLVGLLTV